MSAGRWFLDGENADPDQLELVGSVYNRIAFAMVLEDKNRHVVYWESLPKTLQHQVATGTMALMMTLADVVRIASDRAEEPPAIVKLDERPHSRACGVLPHAHGTGCSRDCPTCHGSRL